MVTLSQNRCSTSRIHGHKISMIFSVNSPLQDVEPAHAIGEYVWVARTFDARLVAGAVAVVSEVVADVHQNRAHVHLPGRGTSPSDHKCSRPDHPALVLGVGSA